MTRKPTFAMRPLAAIATLLLSALSADATTVSPVNIEMTASGPKSRTQITVTNTSSQPIAVEPTTDALTISPTGASSTAPADEAFLILPAQALVPPGASQVFRVQYVGDPAAEQSHSYLITMAELPIRELTSNAGIQLQVSFAVAVNVAPVSGTAALTLVDAGVKQDPTGKRRPYVLVENPTPVHALLRDANITLANGSWSKHFTPSSLEGVLGTGLVQPGARREFFLPADVPPGVTTVTARVEYPHAND
jgi:fimbrial chaperone protein